jgi:hypothetical protein
VIALARLSRRVPPSIARWLAVLVIVGAGGLAVFLYSALLWTGTPLGLDLVVYQAAARRWLAGGGFYPGYQMAAPFSFTPDVTYALPPLLEPPQMLALFVPSIFVPAILWWAIPIGTIAATVFHWRPAPWALAVILLALVYLPTLRAIAAGNASVWLVAALALATRWRLFAVLVFLRPTLFPFALFGIRHRSWWMAAALLGLVWLIALPMDLDWIRSMVHAQGAGGLLHSLDHIPLISIPLVAYVARQRTATGP